MSSEKTKKIRRNEKRAVRLEKMSFEDAATELSNKVYAAARIFEELGVC